MTVADEVLRNLVISRPVGHKDHALLTMTARWICERLSPKAANVAQAMAKADRFVFDGDVGASVQAIRKMGNLDYALILEIAALAANPCWIEMRVRYKDTGRDVRYGYMVEEQNDRTHFAVVCVDPLLYDGIPLLVGKFTAPKLPLKEHEFFVDVGVWYADENPTKDNVASYLFDVTDAMFLLLTPRAVEVREVKHDARLQKARERRRKPPLLEYRQVTLKVGAPVVRYKGESGHVAELTGQRRAAHKVMPHVRVYREGRDTPLVTVIPEHWRGDPALGVILHQRSIKT